MKLYEALGIDTNENRLISLVGGGGKTTTMFKLATEFKNIGKRVLVTTTTAIYQPKKHLYDRLIYFDVFSKEGQFKDNGASITVIGKETNSEGKLLGISPDVIDILFLQSKFDIILVEADGSKRKPIKAPAEHEPVIPDSTTDVIGVIGLDALGKRIREEDVHRPQQLAKVTEGELNDPIDEDKLLKLIVHREGLFKNTPINANKHLLLNKGDLIIKEALHTLVCKLNSLSIQLKEIIIVSYWGDSIRKWSDYID